VREGKSKNARRVVPLTDRASRMLTVRVSEHIGSLVFANRAGGRYASTSINHFHRNAVAPRWKGNAARSSLAILSCTRFVIPC
ncbi:MAG TPA: hypothetical protein VK638_38190, partial [Edaphobacter sp.]|nr:hypothetical protein [Edaphobacter sp.]